MQAMQEEKDKRLKSNMSMIKHKVIVMSGKGGVGKTTFAVNLAYRLALRELNVGILDVDIHGPNIAKMLNIEKYRLTDSEKGIMPINVFPNLKAVSIALTGLKEDQPIIWRGPMKSNVIRQFLTDVYWGKLDYLIVDSPPGTGDELLSICQLIGNVDGAVIVTTPQEVSILDSKKSIGFARTLKVPIIGIVENMSGFICPHCKQNVDVFGKGGGEKTAVDFNIPFLGNIPIEPEIVKRCDSGEPFVNYKDSTDAAGIIDDITDKVIRTMS